MVATLLALMFFLFYLSPIIILIYILLTIHIKIFGEIYDTFKYLWPLILLPIVNWALLYEAMGIINDIDDDEVVDDDDFSD